MLAYLLSAQGAPSPALDGVVSGMAGTLQTYGAWAIVVVLGLVIAVMARHIVKLNSRLEQRTRDNGDESMRNVLDRLDIFKARFFDEIDNVRKTYKAIVDEKSGTIERLAAQKDAEVQRLFDKVQAQFKDQIEMQKQVLEALEIVKSAESALRRQQELLVTKTILDTGEFPRQLGGQG